MRNDLMHPENYSKFEIAVFLEQLFSGKNVSLEFEQKKVLNLRVGTVDIHNITMEAWGLKSEIKK